MICQLVEERLQQLLDERRDLDDFMCSSDPLACHARYCELCSGMAATLEVMGSIVPLEPTANVDLAPRVLATLQRDRPSVQATRPAHAGYAPWRRALVGMTVAAGLLLAIGLRASFAPRGGEVDGEPAVAVTQVDSAPAAPQSDSPRWYPRGVGLASISMAVLTRGNLDMRQVSTPTDEPLLERAMEAVRKVLPAWDPDSTPNSKTGAFAPVLPQVV